MNRPVQEGTGAKLNRMLARPVAFAATAFLLLAIFGATFVIHPGRTAPTRDPAYYTWRTEALLTEEPATLLRIDGPFGMHGGGYRISAPVLGAYLRLIPNVSQQMTVGMMMVLIPVLTALLLAGFAYRNRRDPLLWHIVALTSAGLLLTPPFVGYLENLMGVFFLAAALWFIAPSRESWPARAGLGLFLFVAGITHTTTLAIFGLTLGAITCARFVFGRFGQPGLVPRLRAALALDGPMLLIALVSAVLTYVVWTTGIWGQSAALAESALLFPYSADFFYNRLSEWVAAMRPLLNGPLLLVGAAGLLAVGRRWVDNDLARVSLVWLAPLLGTFGFLFGFAYPYYRFFNTTLAWVLLTGVGAFFALSFFLIIAARGGAARWALVGVIGIVTIIATNFVTGLEAVHWNDPNRGWLTKQKRLNLELLRANLAALDEQRPVVFISDARPPEIETLSQIWGITQLNGNTSRYGLPPGWVDQGYIYQGELTRYLQGEPTVTGNDAYDDLSRAAMEDIAEGLRLSDAVQQTGSLTGDPLIVVASVFNENGPNASIARGEASVTGTIGPNIWALHEGNIRVLSGDLQPTYASAAEMPRPAGDAGLAHLAWVIFALVLLALPGALALRWLFPDAAAADFLAMAPACSIALLVVSGTAVLAVARSPFSEGLAWVSWGVAVVAGGAAAAASLRSSNRLARGSLTYPRA